MLLNEISQIQNFSDLSKYLKKKMQNRNNYDDNSEVIEISQDS